MGKCAKRAFENGGQVSKADQLIAEMNAKYGLGGNAPAPAPMVQQPAPQPQPKPQPAPQPQGITSGIIGIMKGRQQQIDKAAGYAQGGLIRDAAEYWADDNARFDNSNPSFAGLRAVNPLTGFGSAMGAMHTAAGNGDIPGMAMAGISAIPAFGVMRITPASGALKAAAVPSAGRAAGAVSGGAVLNAIADEYQANKPSGYANGGKIEGPGTPTSDSIPAIVNETGEEIRVSNGERIVSAEQGALLEALARKSGFDSLDAMLEAGTGKPVGPTIKGGKRAAAGGADLDKPWYMQDPLSALSSGLEKSMNSSQAAEDYNKSLYPAGTFDGAKPAAYKPVAATAAPSATQNPLALGAGIGGIMQPSDDAKFMTGANPGEMSSSAQGGFTQGRKSYNVNPTSQEGIARVTAPGTSPLYTNIKPEDAVSGLKNQTIGGDAAAVNEGLARYANANKIRGEMIDSMVAANGGNGIAVLPDRTNEANEQLQAMKLSPAEYLAYQQGKSRQEAVVNEADARNSIAMRGQDLQAKTEAARIAGNPIENDLKRAQTKGIAAKTDSEVLMADLQKKAVAGDKQAAATLRALALSGKADRFTSHVVGGGTNELGQAQPQYLAVTGPDGNTVFLKPDQPGANSASSAEKIKADMESGKIKREDAIKQLKAMGYQ